MVDRMELIKAEREKKSAELRKVEALEGIWDTLNGIRGELRTISNAANRPGR